MGDFSIPLFPLRAVNVVHVSALDVEGAQVLLNDDSKDPWLYNVALTKPEIGPHWVLGRARQLPICLPRFVKVAATIDFSFEPPDATPRQRSITGLSATLNSPFVGSADLPGWFSNTTSVESGYLLPSVGVHTVDITWRMNEPFQAPELQCGITTNELLVTHGTPVELVGTNERGLTETRMREAIKLVAATGSDDGHTIMRRLMELFPVYTGGTDLDQEKYGHPVFPFGAYGAWPIAEKISAGGECQAICRFVRAVYCSVGCPGTTRLVFVHADPAVDAGNTALETESKAEMDARAAQTKSIGGQECHLALVAEDAIVGKPLTAPLNNFEGCVVLTDNQVTLYYGGGTGGARWSAAQEVLEGCFRSFVWYYTDIIPLPGGEPIKQHIVAELIATYP